MTATTVDPSTLAESIRARRRTLGLTQEELADIAGCSSRFIREVEAAKATVRLDKVLDLLVALGLELIIATRAPS